MKFKYLFVVFAVAFLSNIVFAYGENDIKGMFPYMGFIYYSDESVVDTSGNRFFRGAVLILPNWLLTSAVQISDNANDIGFPRKTLLARLGAVAIDGKFTLNEDEDEQEREVIKIVRPYNHSATQWWRTDITLMQTLLPFNLTAAVSMAPTSYTTQHDKSCFILTYTRRFANSSEDRILVQTNVELLPPSLANCGSHFFEATMSCANDIEENKNELRDQISSCQGYKGGPLVCEGSVVGLQTYIDNCKAPHLYQLLSPWRQFIDCATKNKCDQIECSDLCAITNKDSPLILETPKAPNTHETTIRYETTINTTITHETTPESTPETSVVTRETAILQTQTTTKEVTEETHETTTEVAPISTIIEEKKERESKSVPPVLRKLVTQPLTPSMKPIAVNSTEHQKHWPNEKGNSLMKANEDDCERNITIEAQQNANRKSLNWVEPVKKVAHSIIHNAEKKLCIQSAICIFVLTSFF